MAVKLAGNFGALTDTSQENTRRIVSNKCRQSSGLPQFQLLHLPKAEGRVQAWAETDQTTPEVITVD